MAVSHVPREVPRKDSPKRMLNSLYNSAFTITWDIGIVLLMIGVIGIFVPTFLGLSLSPMHIFVLASSGMLAIWSGMFQRQTVMLVNAALGVFYILNAVIAFVVADNGRLKIGYGTSEDVVMRWAPGFLNLTAYDHIFHLFIGLTFLYESYSWRWKGRDFPADLSKSRGHHR